MSGFIKICGIQDEAEARLALEAGATALGFLLGLSHRAEDGVTEAVARRIIAGLPAGTETVLVTHLRNPVEVARMAEAIGARSIQVHDAMPPADLARLRGLAPGRRLLKAVHVTGEAALDEARAYAGLADALLLDSRTADRLGGTGQTHDWAISRRIVEAVAPLPTVLAGGLRPENVAAAIAQVRPAGVDVNSGVEDAAGRKDPLRVRAFVAGARAALAG
jgi:phosphoribosylanthranilate isomerase